MPSTSAPAAYNAPDAIPNAPSGVAAGGHSLAVPRSQPPCTWSRSLRGRGSTAQACHLPSLENRERPVHSRSAEAVEKPPCCDAIQWSTEPARRPRSAPGHRAAAEIDTALARRQRDRACPRASGPTQSRSQYCPLRSAHGDSWRSAAVAPARCPRRRSRGAAVSARQGSQRRDRVQTRCPGR
eukprot:4864863-Prymnesium_polylepis.2